MTILFAIHANASGARLLEALPGHRRKQRVCPCGKQLRGLLADYTIQFPDGKSRSGFCGRCFTRITGRKA